MSDGTLAIPGTLVMAREREWIVLPDSSDELLMLRPLGGLDEEITAVLPAIEPVKTASFRLPQPDDAGDFRSGKILREAARLAARGAAGPFRSFGRIAVDPRPYQLVPLMMALKLNPVRMLIADDVGIGKTIEAGLIVRELLDRGEIKRLTVLCPPHLAEQWHRELKDKFHIDTERVLSGTIQRLERDLPVGESVFDRHRFTVVSTDFIKSPRRAGDFAIKCPECVIVDEAHGCAPGTGISRNRQQRFDLLRRITADTTRHLLLVTATPHSGNENAFRSLLSLLNPEFADLPTDPDRAEREGIRRKMARHLVQRRRGDIRHYLESDTAFPERLDKEATYVFCPEYRELFDDILAFAREYASDDTGGLQRRRVRYWSALALLRCVSSSPAAAAATLRSRAAVDECDDTDPDAVDEIGRRTVLDHGDDDDTMTLDFSPGSDTDDAHRTTRKQLLEFARRAETFDPQNDTKLIGALKEIKTFLKHGFRPVVFCRFVDTAEYVAKNLRANLAERIRIECVTGMLPHAERETRISDLTETGGDAYVLVCTDCLSEGINLQHHFDAVLHYDLAWNPTRHEQREGRVDRFGQARPQVRVVTFYGQDNPIDGVILDVLIRKHKSIKSDLGVTVAVPGSSETVAQALFEAALFRDYGGRMKQALLFESPDDAERETERLHQEWENARDREKISRSRFAQHTLNPATVAAELSDVRQAIGGSADVEWFFRNVMHAVHVSLTDQNGSVRVHISPETPRALRQAIGYDAPFTGRFEPPTPDTDLRLHRTSPIIEGLASRVLDQALDPVVGDTAPVAARCGVMATSAVSCRTTLLILRFRAHIRNARHSDAAILTEDIPVLACTGPADAPQWLSADESERLLEAVPSANLVPTAIHQQLRLLTAGLPRLRDALEPVARTRAAAQLEAHNRVRDSGVRGKTAITIQPVLPVDILGAYILLPGGN
jgi:superfamily II DNA or RNA helicase